MTFEERIELAASKTGLREPFIAAVVCKVQRIIVDGDPRFTAATNGVFKKFGKVWCEQWNDEQLFGLNLHEDMHIILMHMWRRGDRDPALWNIANDAIINRMILNKGYQLPPGGVDIHWVTEAMDSDEVYLRLLKEREQNKSKPQQGKGKPQPGQGQPGAGDPGDPDGESEDKGGWDKQGDLEDAPDAATQADIEATILTAAKMARECGDQSALIDRILGNVGKPSVRWQDEVRVMLRSASRDDFTYRKFSRRFIGRGRYMPSLHTESIGGLGIGFDTSGSVSDAMAQQLAAEIQGIVDDTNPDWVEVVYCDASIGGTQRFERGDPIVLKPVGGGGTRFRPVFDHFIDKDEKIAGLIYLTDMEGNLAECPEPDFPVIWGLVGGRQPEAPFGKIVRVDL